MKVITYFLSFSLLLLALGISPSTNTIKDFKRNKTEITPKNDGCYFAVVLSNTSWTKREKTFVRSSVVSLTYTDLFGGANMKDDLQKQFFYFLYDKHNNLLKVFKGDSSYSSITTFFGKSEADVLSKIDKYYGKMNDYKKHVLKDFNYIKDKLSPATLKSQKTHTMWKEINEYLKKGVDLNR